MSSAHEWTSAAVAGYTAAIRRGDEHEATRIGLHLLDRGVPGEMVVSDLLGPAMVEVGLGWERGEWGIAVEHRASSITEAVLVALVEENRRGPGARVEGSRGPAVIASVEGEWHTLPARMAAAVLRMRGADVTVIGPSVPAEDLASFLGSEPVTAVAIASSMPTNLAGAWRTISALRSLGITLVCGGAGFGPDGRWAWALGVDLWAPDFARGADLLLEALDRPARPPRPPAGDASTVAELGLLRREHDDLVAAAMTAALRREPSLGDGDAGFLATREDVAATLAVVASATIVSDPTVATDYVAWRENLLRARSLPVEPVAAAFDYVLAALLPDLTQARAMALTGRAACLRSQPPPRRDRP